MATVNVSYKNSQAFGLPAFEALDLYVDGNLIAGVEPAIQQPSRILLGDSLDLAAFQVVGLSGGKLVKATWNGTIGNAVKPIGVLARAATSGSSNSTKYGEVFLTGCFNADADSPLVWDSSFDTLAKKTTWEGVVGNPDLIFRSRLGLNAS
jgi:hypothetical protein